MSDLYEKMRICDSKVEENKSGEIENSSEHIPYKESNDVETCENYLMGKCSVSGICFYDNKRYCSCSS